MKCTVFGGGGFIGSTIVDRLLAEGHAVKVFERPRVAPYRLFRAAEAVEWVTGDLSSANDVRQAVNGAEVILHLVSTTLPKSSNDDPVYDVQSNLVSSLLILDAMISAKTPRIVFISSGGTVYGTPRYLPIDENHPTNPRVSYGIVKLAIEKYLLLYEQLHGIKSICLRVTNPYGERQRIETAQGAVGVFIHRALKGAPIEIWGNGTVTRDYLHVSDVAEAFLKAIQYSGPHSVFNISSGIGTSLNELTDLIGACLGTDVEKNYLPGRSFDVQTSVLSHQLAQEQLGWRPEISMKEGVARTAAWARGQLFPRS